MSLQEVRRFDTRAGADGKMLINNGYRSQPALDDFQNESAAKRVKASSLPDELYQHGDTSMYDKLGRGQRTKKMTKKGLEY